MIHSLNAAVLLVPSVMLASLTRFAEQRVAAEPPGHAVHRAAVVLAVDAAIDRVIHAGDPSAKADGEVLGAAGVAVGRAEIAGNHDRHDRRVGRDRVAVHDVAEHEIVSVVERTLFEIVGQPEVDRGCLGHAVRCRSSCP